MQKITFQNWISGFATDKKWTRICFPICYQKVERTWKKMGTILENELLQKIEQPSSVSSITKNLVFRLFFFQNEKFAFGYYFFQMKYKWCENNYLGNYWSAVKVVLRFERIHKLKFKSCISILKVLIVNWFLISCSFHHLTKSMTSFSSFAKILIFFKNFYFYPRSQSMLCNTKNWCHKVNPYTKDVCFIVHSPMKFWSVC